jgi:hypothetical protein
MAKAKNLTPHIDYVEHCLELLKDRLEDCNDYLNTVKWTEKDNQDDMEKEFKFQSGLFNNYITWITQYADLSGMVSTLKDLTNTGDVKEVRKGSNKSAYADMLKSGELDDKNDDDNDDDEDY